MTCACAPPVVPTEIDTVSTFVKRVPGISQTLLLSYILKRQSAMFDEERRTDDNQNSSSCFPSFLGRVQITFSFNREKLIGEVKLLHLLQKSEIGFK